MAAKRAHRAERSDNIDSVTTAVADTFGKKPWTSLDLRKREIRITSSLFMFLHTSGYIKKAKGSVRPFPGAPLCTRWLLTEKGMHRAEKARATAVA